jgi:hypothetical protein
MHPQQPFQAGPVVPCACGASPASGNRSAIDSPAFSGVQTLSTLSGVQNEKAFIFVLLLSACLMSFNSIWMLRFMQ